jgi:hypothetical protein
MMIIINNNTVENPKFPGEKPVVIIKLFMDTWEILF